MNRQSLLVTIYRVNAGATLACAGVLLGAGHLLAPPFALPVAALWALGAFFVAFAAWLVAISRRPRLSWAEAALAGALDLGYALTSFAAVIALGSDMTLPLRIAVALVAAPVAVFAVVELTGARRLLDASRAIDPT